NALLRRGGSRLACLINILKRLGGNEQMSGKCGAHTKDRLEDRLRKLEGVQDGARSCAEMAGGAILDTNGASVVFRLTSALRSLLSSECPPLAMPLSQSCKEKLQLQPSLAILLLPSTGGYQPEKKSLRL